MALRRALRAAEEQCLGRCSSRPARGGQSLGAKRHKKLAKALSAATMKRLRFLAPKPPKVS